MLKKFLRITFPYLNHYEVTQSYVWRRGLQLQKRIAEEDRNGFIGHYYEFGVFRGRTLINFDKVRRMAAWRDKSFKQIKIFAFDSFQGLPELAEHDTYDPHFVQGSYACSLPEVKRNLEKNRVRNVEFIEGFYDKTLTYELANRLKEKPPSLVHVDCDTYSSTIQVLEWLDGFALTGAIYFFDDLWRYHGHPDAGELGAINAYNSNPDTRGFLVEHPLGLGSKKVYAFCPRVPEHSVNYSEKKGLLASEG